MSGVPLIADITVADEAEVSSAFHYPSYALVGLIVPTIDSATIGFEVEGPADTWTDVFTNTGTPAAVTLGTADTGAKAVAVPEEVSRLAAAARMRLTFGAAQNGGPYTIKGLFQKR